MFGPGSLAVQRVKLAASGASNSDIEERNFRERALEEKCGVFGVISNGEWPTSLDVAHIICLGLVGLQHRGQESAGIVTCKTNKEPFNVSRSEGLVSSAFNEMSMMSLKGNLGIGHTRYSTTGGSNGIQLAQPFVVHTKYGTIAVAHNGELVNSSKLRETLLEHGVGLTTGGDSELITQCLSQTPPNEFKHVKFRSKKSTASINGDMMSDTTCTHNNASCSTSNSLPKRNGVDKGTPEWIADLNVEEDNITSRLLYLMSLTPISYSLIVMYNECLYATRDSYGNRPLTIGMLVPTPNAGDLDRIPFDYVDNCFVEGWCISSESCPFPSVHAKLKRDVDPGEIIKFERNKSPKTLAIMHRPWHAVSPAFCIFEYVYFARPDSILEGQMVYAVRKRCGERLADESPAVINEEDKKNFIVAPVPESSIPAALGYSQRSNIPYVEVFCKNRYVGRTFIQPSTRLRRLGVAKKFGPLTENFAGKSIILIDDSIVRGTTIAQLVRLLKEAGAEKVHIRIASPPLRHPCYMGINIPTKDELIATHLSAEQLAVTLGAKSLKYLSEEGLRESVQASIKEKLRDDKPRVMMPKLGSNNLAITQSRAHLNETIRNNAQVASRAAAHHKQKSSDAAAAAAAAAAAQPDSDDDKQNNLDVSSHQQDSDGEWPDKVGHCMACLTGKYPVELDEEKEAF